MPFRKPWEWGCLCFGSKSQEHNLRVAEEALTATEDVFPNGALNRGMGGRELQLRVAFNKIHPRNQGNIISDKQIEALKKFGWGTCGPMAKVAFLYLCEPPKQFAPGPRTQVAFVAYPRDSKIDHGFVLIGVPSWAQAEESYPISKFDHDVIVCDAWANMAFPLRDKTALDKVLEPDPAPSHIQVKAIGVLDREKPRSQFLSDLKRRLRSENQHTHHDDGAALVAFGPGPEV
ncbi:MAG TPA: hypothetical protein VM580_32965 [Labilithrix sp.]|nr:hypothetical protein [Labilithrix sp.]